MKSIICCGVLAALGLARAASAQTTTTANKPFSARLSIILPANGTTRALIGSSTGQIGVSYGLRPLRAFQPRLDLDYGRFTRRGNRIEPVTLLATALVPISKRGLQHGVYAGVGLGAAYTRLRLNGASFGTTGLFSGSKTSFASKVFIAYNFTPNIFGEIGYNQLSKIDTINPSNAFIQIGARF